MESEGQFSVMTEIWKLRSCRCVKIERVTPRLAVPFVFSRCREVIEEMVNLIRNSMVRWRL